MFQVLAYDKDIGPNGDLEYSLKSGRGKGKFKIHPKTGMIYSQKGFQAGQEFDLLVSGDETSPGGGFTFKPINFNLLTINLGSSC